MMVIRFGKCTGSISQTVADLSPQILIYDFMAD